jgi:hypothetical protein
LGVARGEDKLGIFPRTKTGKGLGGPAVAGSWVGPRGNSLNRNGIFFLPESPPRQVAEIERKKSKPQPMPGGEARSAVDEIPDFDAETFFLQAVNEDAECFD